MKLWIQIAECSYSVSNIKYYIQCIIKKYETSTIIPLNHVYINRIKNSV